jgi:hypothetical protein
LFQPGVIKFVGGLLEIPIESRSVSFPDLLSNDREAQSAYVEGLFGLGTCFAALATLWFACLVILKCKGRGVGCASGHGFDGIPRRSEEYYPDELHLEQTDDEFSDEGLDLAAATTTNTRPTSGRQNYAFEYRRPVSSSSNRVKTLDALEEYEADTITRPSSRGQALPVGTSDDDTQCGCCSSHPFHTKKRRRRTRVAFLGCSLLSICCSVLLLTEVHTPMEEAADSMASLFVEGHAIVDRIQTTLTVIEDAAEVADEVITTIPFDMTELCPDVPPEFFSSEIGVNPVDVVAFLEQEFETFLDSTAFYMDEIQELTWQIKNGLTEAGAVVQENADKLWILFFWVMATIALTVLAMIGVTVATRKDAQRYPNHDNMFQDDTWSEFILSWLVLPTLVVFTIIGWCLLIATSMSTVVATDVCTAGNPGSPEATIRQALDVWEFSQIDENTYNTIVAYTEVSGGRFKESST